MFKKIVCVLVSVILLFSMTAIARAEGENAIVLPAKSAILMEKSTGEVLWENNADEQLSPASVTKIMTLLLIFEAMDAGKFTYEDMVTVSEHAASMGGSQAYMEVGEQMSVNDMLKAICVSSCNDAAVAMSEKVAGSESVFVSMMNERASQLGMVNTHFSDCTGLSDENHYTTARDIAIMSRALMKYEKIKDYTLIWMDSIRGGQFGLSNTNKLIKSYNGITGLKTGYTSKARYCMSATAMRDNMELISVIMASPTSKERNAAAATLLDYGFANYALVSYKLAQIAPLKVERGKTETVKLECEMPELFKLVKRGSTDSLDAKIELPESAKAPIKKGDNVGKVTYFLGNEPIGEYNIFTCEDVKEKSFFDCYFCVLCDYFMI